VFIAAGHASEPFRSMLERAGSEHRLRGKLIIAGTCDAEELSSDLVQHLIHEHGAVGVLGFDRVVVAQAIRLLIGEMDNLLGELSQPIGAVEFFRRSLESAIRRAESGEPDYAPLVDELRNLRNYYYRVSRRIHGGEPLWAA